jgi:hypothetical protein
MFELPLSLGHEVLTIWNHKGGKGGGGSLYKLVKMAQRELTVFTSLFSTTTVHYHSNEPPNIQNVTITISVLSQSKVANIVS